MNLEGQWEVAVSEVFFPSRYQSVTQGNFMFFEEKRFHIRRNSTISNFVFDLPLRMLLKL